MLLRKLSSLRRIRALLALTLLLMTSAQALASAQPCAKQAAAQELDAMQQMMSAEHGGHDMEMMMSAQQSGHDMTDMDTGAAADCCDHDCDCPATACSSAAAIAADNFNPSFGTAAGLFTHAISVAVIPSFNSPFRPPIST